MPRRPPRKPPTHRPQEPPDAADDPSDSPADTAEPSTDPETPAEPDPATGSDPTVPQTQFSDTGDAEPSEVVDDETGSDATATPTAPPPQIETPPMVVPAPPTVTSPPTAVTDTETVPTIESPPSESSSDADVAPTAPETTGILIEDVNDPNGQGDGLRAARQTTQQPMPRVVSVDDPTAAPQSLLATAAPVTPTPAPLRRQPTNLIEALITAPVVLVNIAVTAINTLLTSIFAPGPTTPAPPTMLFVVLGWVQRELRRTFFNQTPTAVIDDVTTAEDTDLTIAVLANDTDADLADGDVLTVTDYTQPANGTVVLNPTGTFTYTPAANYTGTDTFTYTVSDEASPWHLHRMTGLFVRGGHTSTTTVTVTVTPVNDAPVANPDTYTTPEDTALTISIPNGVNGNDSDPDDDTALTTTIVTPPGNGSLDLNPDGTFTYTPDADFHGTDTFTYRASDGTLSDTATVTITVTPVNDAPVANPDTYTTPEDTALTVSILNGVHGNDSDPDDDTALSATVIDQPTHGALIFNPDGTFTYTPDADFHGTDTFTYRASDGTFTPNANFRGINTVAYRVADGPLSDTATVSITVTPVPDAPVGNPDAFTTAEDTPVTITPAQLAANDTDGDGDDISVYSTSSVLNGTLDVVDGNFVFTPTANYSGTGGFTYGIHDGTDRFATGTVTITINPVNDGPVANPDAYTTPEATALVVTVPNGVTGNDSDADDNTALSATVVDQPTHGSLTLNPDGTFTYIPDANYTGEDTFTYRAFDGTAFSAIATATITVTPRLITAIDDTYTAITGDTITLTPTANDTTSLASPLGDITILTQPANGIVYESFGVLSYRSYNGFLGTDTFTYVVADSADATIESRTATVTINVVRPITANDDAYTAVSGATVELTPVVTVNDTTLLNSPLGAITIVTGPADGSLFQDNGVLTYRSWDGFLGTDTFTYTVEDAYSNIDSNVATVTITVVAYNPLTANDDAYTILGRPTVLTPTANDTTDLYRPFAPITIADGPQHGTLTQTNGVMTYTPTAGYAGTDTFTYTVSDSVDPTKVSNTATVTLTVLVYNPILANDDTYSIPFNTATALAPGVTYNDTTDLGNRLGDVSIVDGPSHGTLSASDGVLTYTPNADYSGTDTFTYAVRDSVDPTKVSAPGTVTLTVHPFSPIVARSDVYTVLTGTFTKLLPFITANDGGSINGLGPITIVTAPLHGYLVQEDGVLAYRAGNDFTGTDTFTYTVSDSFYSDIVSNPATVTLTVVDSPPVYAGEDNITVFTNEPTALTPELFYNDRFPADNPPGAINVLTQPVYGTLSESNGTLTYTPNTDFNGVDSFIYTVADSGDPSIVSLPTLVTLTVTDAITASNDFYWMPAGQTTEFDSMFTYNDVNRTGNPLSDPVFGPTRGGTITKVAGKYYYTPPAGFTGLDSFYYTVTDSENPTRSATALVFVTVEAN